jgi:catechol 2,3-dioxygenase-like lactoylglutathione lyase family enzyme
VTVSIGYLTLGAADLQAAVAFYDAVLPTVGWSRFNRHPGFAGYGPGGRGEGQTLWLCEPFDGEAARPGNGVMLALSADSRAEVDAFHAAAVAAGAGDEGPPGLRPRYSPTWYAAYMRDPTGNKLAIVCTAKEPAP